MISKIILILIRAYQYAISPMMGPSCRYSPSCSEFARQYIKKRGAFVSFFPILKRLFSCNPFSKKPFIDPVP